MADTTVTVGGKEVTFPANRDELYLRWANGDKDAAQVILLVGLSCQKADDLVDEKNLEDASGVMTELIVLLAGALQRNPFFVKHRQTLEPIIIASTLSWDLANTLVQGETHGTRNDRIYSYVYRELIEQIVGVVALLTGDVTHARRSLLESHAFHHVLNCDPFEAFEKEITGGTT